MTDETVPAKLKWWEDKMDEVILGLAMAAISIIAIFILKEKSVPIVAPAITAYGMYMTGKQRNGN